MKKTYSQLLSQYLSIINDSSTSASTLGTTFLNDSVNTICNLQGGKLRFLESTSNMSTVAGQETYQIPNKYRKLIDMYIYSGTGSSTDTIYSPEMVFDPTKWKRILQYRLGSQDVPYFTYVENTSYKIQPVPATTGHLIVLRGRLQFKPLSIADVTNLTVTSIANGGTALVMSGGMTADMIGRYIQITETTAANGGDGMFYEIAGYTSATAITLTKPYEGTSISAGTAACIIGQVPIVPGAYQPAIIHRSIALYWQQQNDLTRAKTYWMMYDGGMEAGYRNDYGGLIQQMLDNEGETEEGSYLPPFASTNTTIMQAPYYFAYQDATGFN